MLKHQHACVVGFVAAACLLLASCDRKDLPTGPTPPPTVQTSTGPIAFVSDRDGTEAIYLANVDGSTVTRLTQGRRPAWSPDGQTIAFGNRGIYVINVDGSGLRRLTQGLDWDPSWSPDGRTLVFQGSDISLVGIDGSNQKRFFDSDGYGSFSPDWSSDGRIVFTVGTFFGDVAPLGMWSIDADGSGARHLGFDGEWPAWSPDGSRIAMVTRSGIEVVDADGSGQRLQVAGQFKDVDWTPDERLIYTRSTTSDGRGRSRIFVSEGASERQLVPEATSPARPDYGDYMVSWRR